MSATYGCGTCGAKIKIGCYCTKCARKKQKKLNRRKIFTGRFQDFGVPLMGSRADGCFLTLPARMSDEI